MAATVRVKADILGSKPARSRLERTADVLQGLGFQVLRIGRFGVSIRGEQGDFSKVLGVEAVPNRAMSAEVNPSEPELRDLIDLVEVAPKPTLY